MSAAWRQRAYLALVAALPLFVAYGVISESEVGLWLALGTALCGAGGFGMAARHVPDTDDAESGRWRRGKRVQ